MAEPVIHREKPSVARLDELLKELVDWERFAIRLRGITYSDIGIIKNDERTLEKQRLALYGRWLRVCTNPTWDEVIYALRAMGENALADNILMRLASASEEQSITSSVEELEEVEVEVSGRTAISLSKLCASYDDIFLVSKEKIEKAIESGEVPLQKFVDRVKVHCHALSMIGDIATTDKFISFLASYCFFLNCDLLHDLVGKCLKDDILADEIKAHDQKVKRFMKGGKITDLRKTLSRLVKALPHETKIKLCVQNVYKEEKLQLVEVLVSVLLRLNRMDIANRFKAVPGSVIIELFVPQNLIAFLVSNSTQKMEFMELIGVFSLQIGPIVVMQKVENEGYTFEEGLINSIEVANLDAFMFLLSNVKLNVDAQITEVSQASDDSTTEAVVQEEVAVEAVAAEQELSAHVVPFDQKEADSMDISKIVFNMNMYYPPDIGRTALIEACRHSDLKMAESLLIKGANPNIETRKGWTALIYAAAMGNTKIAAILLKHNAAVNHVKSSNKATALMYATLSGNANLVAMLLNNKALPNEAMTNGVTPLIIACLKGHSRIVKKLILAKVDLHKAMSDAVTPFLIACENGHIEIVQQFLNSKAGIADFQTPTHQRGTTPFMAACKKGHLKVVKLLLEVGVNAQIPEFDGTTPLFAASKNGHLAIVERVLQEGADPNIPRENGATPIYIACQEGHLKIVEKLIAANAIPTCAIVNTNLTPLYIACRQGHLDIVDKLLQLPDVGLNPNVQTNTGITPLFIACHNGHLEIVKRLLQAHASPNIPAFDNASPLLIACQMGHLKIVEVLLNAHANPNTHREDGLTPLLLACQLGQFKIVQLLLQAGAVPACMPKPPFVTPLLIAIMLGHLEIVQELLKFKADPDVYTPSDKATPLFIASQEGHSKIVEALLRANANPNICYMNMATPLYVASQQGHTEVIEMLLKAKVDVNAATDEGETPLFVASKHGHLLIVEKLLKAKANAELQKSNGATPLFIASQEGHLKVVKRLLQEGVDPETPSNTGTTPFHIACFMGHIEIAEKFLTLVADPDAPANDGSTPLFLACMGGHVEIVKLLLSNKDVDPDSPAGNGYNPLSIASRNACPEIVKLLLDHGADRTLEVADMETNTHKGLTAATIAMEMKRSLKIEQRKKIKEKHDDYDEKFYEEKEQKYNKIIELLTN